MWIIINRMEQNKLSFKNKILRIVSGSLYIWVRVGLLVYKKQWRDLANDRSTEVIQFYESAKNPTVRWWENHIENLCVAIEWRPRPRERLWKEQTDEAKQGLGDIRCSGPVKQITQPCGRQCRRWQKLLKAYDAREEEKE